MAKKFFFFQKETPRLPVIVELIVIGQKGQFHNWERSLKLDILEENSLRGMRIMVLIMRMMMMTQSKLCSKKKMWNDDGDLDDDDVCA